MKKFLLSSFLLLSFSCAEQTEILVYTSIENERLPDYQKSFEAIYPNIKIKWVRDSTGVITARLLAEKDNPQADAIFGVGASSLLILKNLDLLEPYTPQGFELIVDNMKDTSEQPVWTGTSAWATSICVNNILLKKYNLPMPKTWEELTNPIYKGLIATPHPASSGSGYMNVSGWLQTLGEEKGWEYMDKLHPNIKSYVHSGTKPCAMAAQGEVVFGISSSSFAQDLIKRRAPLTIMTPTDGVGWELEAAAILKGTKNLPEVQKLMDWATSDDIGLLGKDFSGLTSRPEFMTDEGKEIYENLMTNDLEWSAQNRERILREWQNRYDQ